MLKLETDRLLIAALDLENFKLYIEDTAKLEKNLGVKVTGRELSTEIKEIFTKPYHKALNDKENYLWYTNWQIILKDENKIISGITFKGPVNRKGEVEVGYGIDQDYQNKGYMTETLKSIIKWAFRHNEIKSVVAETNKDNKTSQRVLKKVGMKKYKEEKTFWYKIDKNN
ncbi:GNAT family N-acetyltransferase [Halanaerobium saccharolyticum]|uniref:GNAT family N-acetyltransferase n=1 Tax=Halanaerobium saccharolyticum TaxID=43595 RepID=UPI003FCE3ACC